MREIGKLLSAGAATFAAVALLHAPLVAQEVLQYSGDADGSDYLTSEIGTSLERSMVYNGFTVTGAGWNVTGIFGNFYGDFTPANAAWEIRSGMSDGNGGALDWHGTGGMSVTANSAPSMISYITGGELFSFTGLIEGLSFYLAPGTYWLGMSPIGAGSGEMHIATTSGAGAVSPTGGSNYFDSPDFGLEFAALSWLGYDSQFSFGLTGTFSDQPDATVPEPATMTLLATGLAGIAAARRRQNR